MDNETREYRKARAKIAIKKFIDFRTRVEAIKSASIFDKADKAESALGSAVDVLGDMVFLINDLVASNGE